MNPSSDQQRMGASPWTAGRLLIAVLIVIGHVGCGIKGPPVPAGEPALPAVSDLEYHLDGHAATLTWRLTGRLDRRQPADAVFDVYQSRSALSKPRCDTCPLIYAKVATVPYVDTAGHRYATVLTLDSGYRYLFKVRLNTHGQSGEETEPVRFDLPSKEAPGEGERP